MARKPKVTTLEELREAVESIKGKANAKKFLIAILEELEEEGEVNVEHGDIKGGVAFLDCSDEIEDEEDEEDEEEEEPEDEEEEPEDEEED